MTTMTSALKAIGGGQVTEVIPANAIALTGDDSATSSSFGSGKVDHTPADRPDIERLISLG